MKKFFTKTIISLAIFSFLMNGFIFSTPKVFAQSGSSATDQAVQGLNNLNNNGQGLIPACGRTGSAATDNACSPKQAAQLLKNLFQVVMYLIIIALVLTVVFSAIGYVFYGKSPEFLNKRKKYIKNSLEAILYIGVLFIVLFGLLSALGFNAQLLDFLKQLFAFNDFSLIPHALAQQNVPVIPTTGNNYINFFPGQTIISIILLTVKFLVNYIAGPILVIAVIGSGFMFVRAQGNPTKLGEAKAFAMRVLIAIVIVAAAQMFIAIVLNTIKTAPGFSSPTTQTTTTPPATQ